MNKKKKTKPFFTLGCHFSHFFRRFLPQDFFPLKLRPFLLKRDSNEKDQTILHVRLLHVCLLRSRTKRDGDPDFPLLGECVCVFSPCPAQNHVLSILFLVLVATIRVIGVNM